MRFSLPARFALAVLSLSIAWAVPRSEVEMPIDIGVGPSLHMLPIELSDGQALLPGIAMQAYVVVTPEVLKQYANRIPRSWRRMVSLDQELHIKPYWLTLMPTTLLIHPGKGHQAWAASWSLMGLEWNARPSARTELAARIQLPTVTYAWIQSPRIEEGDTKFLGIGVTPGVQAVWRPWKTVQFSLSWDEHLYLPIATTQYTPLDKTHANWISHGVASFLVHVRIPTLQKI